MKDIHAINPITAKQITGEFFLKTPKFFYSDPKYRKVTGNAVKLYTYLRDRLQYFTMKQEEYEQGEWSKSYVDEDGYLYIICDNTELLTVLGFGKDALQAAKKNLEKFGLLRQKQVMNSANRLYIGSPNDIQENWDYKKEIKEKQAAAKAKKAAEYKKRLEKEEAEKKEDKTPQTRTNTSRTENPLYGRTENPPYVGRKTRPYIITNKDLELKDRKELKDLINISFSLEDIANKESELKEKYPTAPFDEIKINLLNDPNVVIKKESNYFGLLNARLENYRAPSKRGTKFTRSEIVPEWFNDRERAAAYEEPKHSQAEIDAMRAELLESLGKNSKHQGQA